MKREVLVLSVYPLSGDYLAGLERILGRDFEQMTLAELRQHGGVRLLTALRRIRPETLLLPLEDENSVALLPILKLLAGVTAAKHIGVVQPGLALQSISRFGIASDLIRFALASVGCLVSAVRAWLDLRTLVAGTRLELDSPQPKGPVLYLKTNLWFGIKAGGSIGHIAGVVNALQLRNCPVTFASAEPPVMVDADVEIRKIAPPATFGLPYELNNYRFQAMFAQAAERILQSRRYCFIYQRLSAANYLGVALSRKFRLPLVVEYNGSEVWIAKHWGRAMRFHALAAKAEDAMLRHAHLVVTISDVLRDELVENGVQPERIVCYPNCIDPAVFSPDRFPQSERDALRARYGIAADAVVVAFIGTFGQWHGAEVLAEAIARLYSQEHDWLAKNKVHFLLVGDGLKMPQVRDAVEKSGAGAVCTLAGLVPQDQAALHLAAADILASPHVPNADGTRFFGSPTKLFEYMAMGKGIIASDLDQIGVVLSPGLRATALPSAGPAGADAPLAVLCEPGSVEDLLRGLKFLVERPDWRVHLGKNARARALERYTWAHHVQAILNGLDGVLRINTTTRV